MKLNNIWAHCRSWIFTHTSTLRPKSWYLETSKFRTSTEPNNPTSLKPTVCIIFHISRNVSFVFLRTSVKLCWIRGRMTFSLDAPSIYKNSWFLHCFAAMVLRRKPLKEELVSLRQNNTSLKHYLITLGIMAICPFSTIRDHFRTKNLVVKQNKC